MGEKDVGVNGNSLEVINAHINILWHLTTMSILDINLTHISFGFKCFLFRKFLRINANLTAVWPEKLYIVRLTSTFRVNAGM